MTTTEIFIVLQWWFTLFLLGIGFLPLTFFLFEKFFDKGYIFAKILALAITSYLILLVGMVHLIPFSFWSSLFIFLIISIGNFMLLPNKWKIRFHLTHSWKIFLFEELFFLATLFFWVQIRTFAPDIHGLEKYMDYGFINSVLRADFFPPRDMWFTPLSINYYYFGHLATAILTQLSLIPSQFTFNLMLSTVFAWCVVESFSLGANLYTFLCKEQRISPFKRFFSGILSAGLVAFSGNLHVLYSFFKPYETDKPQPFWELPFLPETFPNAYWYPNATRYIYHTIHEFPLYSWVVSDLHGHVLDIPFVLLTIAVLFSLFLSYYTKTKIEDDPLTIAPKSALFAPFMINPLVLGLVGFLLAIMYMTNAWDGAIYFLLTTLVVFFIHWQKLHEYKDSIEKEEPVEVISSATQHTKKIRISRWKIVWTRDFLLSLLLVGATFTAFTLPYNYFFVPFVSGIGVLCAPEFLTNIEKIGPFLFEKDHCQHSNWWELMTLYGFFYFFVISFIIILAKTKKVFTTDIFVLFLIILGSVLIIIPEFMYVKDIYPAHFRANTMFKLVFQAFMMLSICSAYIIARIFWVTRPTKKRFFIPFVILTLLLLFAVFSYPQFAINSYYGNLLTQKGLDGTKYLEKLYPNDYAAINWLNENVKGQPIIIEAQGDSYTDYARVSANTGLPTILGWTVHEWLWRGTYDIPAPRIQEVQMIYETTNADEAQALLDKYHAEYVFIGAMEREKYPALQEEKFNELGKVVFEQGTTKIYQVK